MRMFMWLHLNHHLPFNLYIYNIFFFFFLPIFWLFWIVVLEKTLESKEIKPVTSKGNRPWIFIVKIDAESEAPIFWPPDAKNQLIEKKKKKHTLILGKIEGRRRRGQQRIWLDSIDSMDMSLSRPWEMVKDGEAWHTVVHGVTKIQTRLSDWTATIHIRVETLLSSHLYAWRNSKLGFGQHKFHDWDSLPNQSKWKWK